MSEQMSVTRALASLKNLDSKIYKKISEFQPIIITNGPSAPFGYDSVQSFEDRARAEWQAITDLIVYRNALKTAVIESNANTEVEIAGTKMSVAAAIDMKSSIDYYRQLMNTCKNAYLSGSSMMIAAENDANRTLETQLNTLLGTDRKSDEAERKSIEEAFRARRWPKLRDPLSVKTKIEELSAFIEDFTSNIDFVLSESNARTVITV